MRPLPEYEADTINAGNGEENPVDSALAWHGGDAMATIATLLADCAYLRRQLDLTRAAMGHGFTRGWEPSSQRD